MKIQMINLYKVMIRYSNLRPQFFNGKRRWARSQLVIHHEETTSTNFVLETIIGPEWSTILVIKRIIRHQEQYWYCMTTIYQSWKSCCYLHLIDHRVLLGCHANMFLSSNCNHWTFIYQNKLPATTCNFLHIKLL